jgi:hypothetical protein
MRPYVLWELLFHYSFQTEFGEEYQNFRALRGLFNVNLLKFLINILTLF